jgi:LPXTG-site transpeptidase (sortase) family protein
MSLEKTDLLRWIERALWTLGVLLAGWTAFALIEVRRVSGMPVQAAAALAPGTWIARLEAPSARLTATVLEGSDDDTLKRAAGHIEGTALPGQLGNVGIAGHRDTVFRRVRLLKVGDILKLRTSDSTLEYRISKTMIVKPDAIEVLDATGRPTLTLVTCYPFTFIGSAPKRFIVQAELVEGAEKDAGRRVGSRPARERTSASGAGRPAGARRPPRRTRCCPPDDRRSRQASDVRSPASSVRPANR